MSKSSQVTNKSHIYSNRTVMQISLMEFTGDYLVMFSVLSLDIVTLEKAFH